jgi:hypothetical protein
MGAGADFSTVLNFQHYLEKVKGVRSLTHHSNAAALE